MEIMLPVTIIIPSCIIIPEVILDDCAELCKQREREKKGGEREVIEREREREERR